MCPPRPGWTTSTRADATDAARPRPASHSHGSREQPGDAHHAVAEHRHGQRAAEHRRPGRSDPQGGSRTRPPARPSRGPASHTTVPVSGSTSTRANPSGVRAVSNTGPRIRPITSSSPSSPSANVSRSTPWRTTDTAVMSGVRPIIAAAGSAPMSHRAAHGADSRAPHRGEAQAQLATTQRAFQHLQSVDPHLGAAVGVPRMKVRRTVVVEEHRDHDPEEAADRRHDEILAPQTRPVFQPRARYNAVCGLLRGERGDSNPRPPGTTTRQIALLCVLVPLSRAV